MKTLDKLISVGLIFSLPFCLGFFGVSFTHATLSVILLTCAVILYERRNPEVAPWMGKLTSGYRTPEDQRRIARSNHERP